MRAIRIKEWKHNFTCSRCLSEWEATVDDVKFNDKYYVQCAACGTIHYIDEDVPYAVEIIVKRVKRKLI